MTELVIHAECGPPPPVARHRSITHGANHRKITQELRQLSQLAVVLKSFVLPIS
jgi:hypothetical protein